MRVGLCHEGHCPPGTSHRDRYHEMIAEAVLAEQAGFDFYGISEQHFLPEVATTPSPELMMAVVASKTESIRLRFMSAVASVNHPIRIVERLNTLDVLSDGRAELGLARSNNPFTLAAFGVPADTTRQRLVECVDIIFAAFTTGRFIGEGELWQVPDREVVPVPVQRPHPPVFLSATSAETHSFGADNGIGIMSGNTVLGWDYLQNNVNIYKEAIGNAKPLGGFVNNSIATFVAACNCAPTMAQAKREAEPVAYMFMDTVMELYTILAGQSSDYEYLGKINDLDEHKHDLDYLMEFNPYFHVGTPEFLIERFLRLKSFGLDELILRVDGMGHAENTRAIEMIGEHVIPALQ